MQSRYFYSIFLIILFFSYSNLFSQDPNVYSFTFDGKQYEVVKMKMKWEKAAEWAVDKGGHLAEINSGQEQDAIYDAIINGAGVATNYTTVFDGGGIAYVWIGATDKKKEGEWLWDGDNDGEGENFWNGQGNAGAGGGEPVDGSFINWGGSEMLTIMEPDDYNGNQDAAAIALNGWPGGSGALGRASEWNDINIGNSLYFVVEYKKPLMKPELIKPADGSTDMGVKPVFEWDAEDGDYYNLQVSETEAFDGELTLDETITVENTYTPETTLQNGTKYYWRVRSSTDDQESEWSDVWSFTTIEAAAPDAPEPVSPEDKAVDVPLKPDFEWTDVMADFYTIQFSVSGDFENDLQGEFSELTENTFQSEFDFDYSTTYHWRVKAVTGEKESAWSDVWSFTTLDAPKPDAPELLYPEDNASDVDLQPEFRFSPVDNADSYTLIISDNEDLSEPVDEVTVQAGDNSGTVNITVTLEQNTTYYWAMYASNASGPGEQSPVRNFLTKDLTGVADNNKGITDIEIYPNPASSSFRIMIPEEWDAQDINVVMFDMAGRAVDIKSETTGKSLVVIPGNIPAGVYYVRVSSGETEITGKVIIAK